MSPLILLTLSLSVFFSPWAQAQSSKPGLWEHRVTIRSASGEISQEMAAMRQQMADMPPEQRKAMEQMMAQSGISMSSDGQSTTVRNCLSPEEAAKAEVPNQDEDCKYTIVQRSASFLKVQFACTNEESTRGEGEIRFTGNTAYNSKFEVNSQANGKPEKLTMTQSGKWLSASCGKTK